MAKAGDSLRRLATRAERMERQWPSDAAALLADELESAAKRDTGGDGRLSHGRKLGAATVTVRRHGNGAAARADSPRIWGVLEKARPARRTWSKGVKASKARVDRSAEQAFRQVVRG